MKQSLLIIVEGHGESLAMPTFIERILKKNKVHGVNVIPPFRFKGLPINEAAFKSAFRIWEKYCAPILFVADYDCPKDCVDVLRDEACFKQWACEANAGLPFEASFLVKEFESLALLDQDAIKTVFPDLKSGAPFPLEPEKEPRNAKGWIKQHLPRGKTYKPTEHQLHLAQQLNLLLLTEKSPSFQRLEAHLLRLVTPSP